jgi:hypothetical protein
MSFNEKMDLEEDIGKMCSFLISDEAQEKFLDRSSVDGHTERRLISKSFKLRKLIINFVKI